MKTNLIRILLPVLAALLAGCESAKPMSPINASLARYDLVSPEQAKAIEQSLTDKDIANLLSVDIKAKLPTNLAVARLGSDYRYNLAVMPADEVAGWEKALAGLKSIRSVRAVTPLIHRQDRPTLQTLRSAAAQMNCELLLVYVEDSGSVDNYTDAAALYWTLVGLWVAPGNVYQHKTVLQAALVDCRTGVILATAGGQCEMKTVYAAAYKDIAHDKLDSQTPAKALEELRKNAGQAIARAVADSERGTRAPG
jgi:hypothetical protein